MNRKKLIPISALLLLPAYLGILLVLSTMHKNLPKAEEINVILPSPVLKVTSLEYDGLASDLLYLKALVFYGSTWSKSVQREVKGWEYDWMYESLKASTDLDPYFLDPYFFANGILTWEAKRVKAVNSLLEKGCEYRTWDYWLPFYLGFNYYYFLNDNVDAAKYLMEASKKPGADPFYAYFAARLAYKGNKTENAIIFLESVLKTTKDKTMRSDYEKRLKALKGIYVLEQALAEYKERIGKYPDKLDAVIAQGVIKRMPVDPYGGMFYIDENGSVKTTSDLR